METIKNLNSDNMNIVNNNKKENDIKRLNLLFIEGNRQKIDKENVKQSYNKIMSLGYIKSMPIEYITMKNAKEKLSNKLLYKAIVIRKTGDGEPTISNFDIKTEIVSPENYDKYDGICIDGQHRSLALLFPTLQDSDISYTEIEVPNDMDILSYIALRNNGKTWENSDFYNSGISTNDTEIDYILSRCKDYKAAFIFALYTFGTNNLTANQIKSIQLGYKKSTDFGKLQLNNCTREIGDKILIALKNNSFLSTDRFTGRFASGLKKYYNETDKDIDKVLKTIDLIDKIEWEKHFTPDNGQSMEAKSYVEAFMALYAEYESTSTKSNQE